ncbi:MAG TPA: GNAT family protein [Acidimicrobiia bacterium]|nr:GNAT family protein [Acidimicrobiia bacterium]
MTLVLRPATDDDVREFAAWQYETPYDVYNIAMSLDDAVAYFVDPAVRCYSLIDGSEVVGYCTFGGDAQVPGGNYDGDGLDIGLGIKPARTGSGEGHRYVSVVVDHAAATFGPRQLRVTIAVGNVRALRVWSRAGFAEISRFVTSRILMGSNEFAILAFEAPATGATRSSAEVLETAGSQDLT